MVLNCEAYRTVSACTCEDCGLPSRAAHACYEKGWLHPSTVQRNGLGLWQVEVLACNIK